MQSWLLYSFGAFFLWGFWGFFCKIAAQRGLDWKGIYIYSSSLTVLMTGIFLFSVKFQVPGSVSGKLAALGAGIVGTGALLCFYTALTHGKISIVVPVSSLYPAVTIILALIFFKEKVSMYNVVGMVLALCAIYFLAHE